MPSIAHRVTKLKKLYNIRCGDGAALLPANITKIHMTFPVREKGGYLGARQFWRHILPRMKYYNPSIRMMVSRPVDRHGECLMRVYVKRSKEAKFLPSKSIEDLAPSGDAKVPFRPLEHNEDWVPEVPRAFAPPNPSFDEDVIELPMRNLSYQHIWVRFKHRIPVTLVSNEVAMVKDFQDIGEQARLQKGEVEGDAGRRWLEMFKKEQAYVREIEALHERERANAAQAVEKAAEEDSVVRADKRKEAPARLVEKGERKTQTMEIKTGEVHTALQAIKAALMGSAAHATSVAQNEKSASSEPSLA